MKQLVLTVIFIGMAFSRLPAADQYPPPLSLTKAARIAEAKIEAAKLPSDQFLRDIHIQSLPDGKYCYMAFYEPPVMRGWVSGSKPSQDPVIIHFLRINMDGTAVFEKSTVTRALTSGQI